MRRQRPAPSRNVGAVACLALVAVGAGACGSGGSEAVEIERPSLDEADTRACGRLLAALPDTIAGQKRRTVTPEGAYGAAWGDPPIILRCGVSMPPEFDDFSSCQVANGVAWFAPEGQFEDQSADVVLTTVGRTQNIEVQVPAEYRPPVDIMVDLASAVKKSTRETDPCL